MSLENPRSIRIPVIKVSQPIGDFYVGTMKSADLVAICDFDVRRIDRGEGLETYLGIQRELSKSRVTEISQYVEGPDATFPTAVVLAVQERSVVLALACAESESHFWLELSNFPSDDPEENIFYRQIARVIDGQHRIEGLRGYERQNFEVNVSIFVGADIPDQATIFSTVNLAQTKVNRSLVYDLFDLAKSLSPEKLAHNVVVALDRAPNSPFYQRIKRLGTATAGREDTETLAQATIVAPLLQYMSGNQMQVLKDRQTGLRGGSFESLAEEIPDRLILRPFLLENRDIDLADLIWNYFDAVQEKWPKAWAGDVAHGMLNRTNGFNALMRFFRPAYLSCEVPGRVASKEQFIDIFAPIDIADDDLNSKIYVPGTSGATALFKDLIELSNIEL